VNDPFNYSHFYQSVDYFIMAKLMNELNLTDFMF